MSKRLPAAAAEEKEEEEEAPAPATATEEEEEEEEEKDGGGPIPTIVVSVVHQSFYKSLPSVEPMRKCGHTKVVLIMFVFRAVGLTGVDVPAQREEQGLNN